MMVVPESQIRALIRLLSDEDARIVETIRDKLIDIGPVAVPLLQEAEIEQPEMADRIASVLEEIRGGKLEDELARMAAPAHCTAAASAGSRAGVSVVSSERASSGLTARTPGVPARVAACLAVSRAAKPLNSSASPDRKPIAAATSSAGGTR